MSFRLTQPGCGHGSTRIGPQPLWAVNQRLANAEQELRVQSLESRSCKPSSMWSWARFDVRRMEFMSDERQRRARHLTLCIPGQGRETALKVEVKVTVAADALPAGSLENVDLKSPNQQLPRRLERLDGDFRGDSRAGLASPVTALTCWRFADSL